MTPERYQVPGESESGAGVDSRRPGVRTDLVGPAPTTPNPVTGKLAGFFVRAYFVLFYNTNFLLNATLSLTVIIPLLVAQRIGGTADGSELSQQVAVTIYLSLLYAVVYVENDLIDYKKDTKCRPFKVSLLTHTGSRRSAALFGLWVGATLVAAVSLWPRLGMLSLGYTMLLIAVGAVHSYLPRLKPVTLFIERGTRLLAPPVLIYSLMPSFMTRVFLLTVLLVYPLMMESAYTRYLTRKLGWRSGIRRWSLRLYAFYYSAFVLGVLVHGLTGSDDSAPSQAYPPAAVIALVLAPVLLVLYLGYERGVRRLSQLLPDGLIPDGNPAYPGERNQAACEMLVTTALIGLLLLSA